MRARNANRNSLIAFAVASKRVFECLDLEHSEVRTVNSPPKAVLGSGAVVYTKSIFEQCSRTFELRVSIARLLPGA